MAARRPFWKWHRWKSIGFCLWPPSTCIWNLKLKFQSKLDLCSGNHVVYRQTDRRTDGRTRWIQYTPPPTSLGGGIIMVNSCPPSAAYMCQRITSALVQIMACHLFGAKPLSKPMLAYCQLDHRNKLQRNFNQNTKIFIHEKCIWKYQLQNGNHFV